MLTKEQKKRLAKEARQLAMRVAGGGSLSLGNQWGRCAASEIVRRAGMEDEHGQIAHYVDGLLPDGGFGIYGLLSHATQDVVRSSDAGLLAFPFLATADALEESARK